MPASVEPRDGLGQHLVAGDRHADGAAGGRVGRAPRRCSPMIAAVSSRRAGSAGRTVSVWPPTTRLSPSGVSWAITRPWSMTVISSASASASSRYCVVSRTVEPSPTRPRTTPHMSSRLAGSRPVVGSSRKTTDGPADEAGGEVEPAAHAAGVGLGRPVGGVGEVEPVEQLLRAGARRLAAQVQQRADQLEVLAAGQQLVDGGVLAGEADQLPDAAGLAGDVVARRRRRCPRRRRAASRGSAPRWSCRRRWGRARRARCPRARRGRRRPAPGCPRSACAGPGLRSRSSCRQHRQRALAARSHAAHTPREPRAPGGVSPMGPVRTPPGHTPRRRG